MMMPMFGLVGGLGAYHHLSVFLENGKLDSRLLLTGIAIGSDLELFLCTYHSK